MSFQMFNFLSSAVDKEEIVPSFGFFQRNQPPWAPHPSSTLQPVELPEERAGPSKRSVPAVSFGAPPDDRMSITALEGEPGFSRDKDSAVLPPLGMVALSESDPDLMAILSWAAESVGLEWNPPPCPEPSWLEDWFLEAALAGSLHPAPVPFFPEVHATKQNIWHNLKYYIYILKLHKCALTVLK